MSVEQKVRLFAGLVILTSLLLAHFHSQNWLWVTAFVGANLLQSSLTKCCPLETILSKFGKGEGSGKCCGG